MVWFGLLLNFGIGAWMLAANFARMGRPDLRNHTLGISCLWLIAGVVLMGRVWTQTGDLSMAQSVWFLTNLASVLTVLFVHQSAQGVWVEAKKQAGETNISNWSALIHAGVVSAAVLFIASFTMVMLVALGVQLPIDVPQPEPVGTPA